VAKRRVDRAFVDAVQGHGDDVRAAYGVALRTHRVACAIARSALDGTPVDLAGAS
jgi:predicted dehydrogenase